MAGHNGHNAFIDQLFVDSSEGLVPFLAGHLVDAHDQVLVVFFGAVAGEVLHAGGHVLSSGTLEKCLGEADHVVGIVIKGADLHNGVSPVVGQVHDGGEVPVATYGAAFYSADTSHFISRFFASGSRYRRSVGHGRAAAYAAVSAGFTVGSDQQRNPGRVLQRLVLLVQRFGAGVVVADGAGVIGLHHAL